MHHRHTSLSGSVGAINPTVTSCGGVLIEPNWLLTARHCAPPNGVVGFPDSTSQLDESRVATIARRFCLDGSLSNNDLALLQLDWPAEAEPPPPLPWRDARPSSFDSVYLIGWGDRGRLRSLELELLNAAATVEAYFDIWGDNAPAPGHQLLATRGIKRNALKGDSGGPLIGIANQRPYLLGILSSGDLRGGIDLYSDIDSHRGWLEDVVGSVRHTSPGCRVSKTGQTLVNAEDVAHKVMTYR